MDINIKDYIRGIPDFPKPGILFYDISPLLSDGGGWRVVVDRIAEIVRGYDVDLLIGIESRGFLIAAAVSYAVGCGFAMIRKAGKLPGETISHEYDLEYGKDRIEIHTDAITPGQKVILLDDLLATGGTAAAGVSLLRKIGAEVLLSVVVIELSFLNGRERLDIPCTSLIQYDQ